MTTVKLNFHDQNTDRINFADQVVVLLERIVNDTDFLNDVKIEKYAKSRFRKDDVGAIFTTKLTGVDIAKLIEGGKEFRTIPDNTINLEVRIRKLRKDSTVGAMDPPEPLITTNSTFFNKWLKKGWIVSCAAHWMHEWLHVAGFRHITDDHNDVPYVVGRLVAKAGKRLLKLDATNGIAISDKDLGNDYLKRPAGHEEIFADEADIA